MSDFATLAQTFLRVVEAGSISAVARQENTSQPTISRRLGALEHHLGARLLQRTTRALSLTEEGRIFLAEAVRVRETITEAESSVGSRSGEAAGTLRLACAVVMGRLHVVPRLGRFLEAHPRMAVDLRLDDAFIDMVAEGVDLAIRVGEVAEPHLVARRIGTTRRALVATPLYLARRGEPKTLADLGHHDCILYSRLAAGDVWNFSGPNGPVAVPIKGRFRVDNTEGVRAAILAGLGIGFAPVWHFIDDIERGALRAVLPDFEPRPQPISAVYPSKRFLAPKVRAMIDFLAADFAAEPKLR